MKDTDICSRIRTLSTRAPIPKKNGRHREFEGLRGFLLPKGRGPAVPLRR